MSEAAANPTVEQESQASILRGKIREKAKIYDLNIKDQRNKAVKEIIAENPNVLASVQESSRYAAVVKHVPNVLAEMTNRPPVDKTVTGDAGGAKVKATISKKGGTQQPMDFDPTKPQLLAEQKAPELIKQMQTEQSQIMQTNDWALNYWQYLGVWTTVAMTLKTFKMPAPNKSALEQLAVQWATIHTKNHWSMPPSLEVALLCAGTAGAFGLPIAVKLGMFSKKKKEKEPPQSKDRISEPPKGESKQ